MKIIHCADLHLDSRLSAHFDRNTARKRRTELLENFSRLFRWAKENQAESILIAGDLFDTDYVSASASNLVLDVVREYREITCYYLKGNHDRTDVFSDREDLPENLKTFSEEWTSYDISEKVRLCGRELTRDNAARIAEGLETDPEKVNIVMLHGQASKSRSEAGIPVYLEALSGKNIDYLALGHLHSFMTERLDERGRWVYSGCLEGRGFDETGEKGFVLLEIDPETGWLDSRFVPFARRRLFTLNADVTGCVNSYEMIAACRKVLEASEASPEDLCRICLTGEVDAGCEKDLLLIRSLLDDDRYYLEVRDETRYRIDPEAYRYDETLTGVFIRSVMQDPALTEDEKAHVIRAGLQALRNEEVQP